MNNINMWVEISGQRIEFNDWKKKNPPDILEVFDNPKSIHKSWFGGSHYYNSTGYYFTHPWSLMCGCETHYNYNGNILNEQEFNKKFKFIDSLPGTGGGVIIYQKI